MKATDADQYCNNWSKFCITIVILYTHIKLSVCVSVLFLMHGHSFGQICMKFGMWHPYTLQIVTGVSEHCLSPRLALSWPKLAGATDWAAQAVAPSGNWEWAASNHNGSSIAGVRIEHSRHEVWFRAIGASVHRSLLYTTAIDAIPARCPMSVKQVSQLSLTNPRVAQHHD